MKQVWSKITCLNCQTEIIKVKETYLNPNVDKTLKKRILNDEYFYEICPQCHQVVKSLYPCIYKDAQKKLIIYLKEKTAAEAKGYHQRYVSSVDDFKELIRIYEDGLDDRKVLILKRRLKQYCEKKQPVSQIHYDGCESGYVFFNVDDEIKGVSMEQLDHIQLLPNDESVILEWKC